MDFLAPIGSDPVPYLDRMVRDSISTFSKVGNIDLQLAQLERDISSGEWERRYSSLQNLSALDLGYRIVIANKRAAL
jgi:hypothetical protein